MRCCRTGESASAAPTRTVRDGQTHALAAARAAVALQRRRPLVQVCRP
jgi:hypothetical protein